MYSKIIEIDGLARKFSITCWGEVKNEETGNVIQHMRVEEFNREIVVRLDKKQYCLSFLLATAYIPNSRGYVNVKHIDGNKKNNVLANLEWTGGKGRKRRSSKKTKRVGRKYILRKLSDQDIRDICILGNRGISADDIRYRLKLDVCSQTIQNVLSGVSWQEISSEYGIEASTVKHQPRKKKVVVKREKVLTPPAKSKWLYNLNLTYISILLTIGVFLFWRIS